MSVGAMDSVSQITLPGEVAGERIVDEEHAWKVAVEHTENRLRHVSERFGLTFECIRHCDTGHRYYRLKPTVKADFCSASTILTGSRQL